MKCRHCVSGKSNICETLGMERSGFMHSDKKTRFSIKGKPVYHYCAVSSFSEYTVVHSGCAVKISSAAPMEKVCLLSCGAAAGTAFAYYIALCHIICYFFPINLLYSYLLSYWTRCASMPTSRLQLLCLVFHLTVLKNGTAPAWMICRTCITFGPIELDFDWKA